jgi:hypothetical protein
MVAAYVSPPSTVQATRRERETVVASNVAEAACAPGPAMWAATATLAAASAATTGSARRRSRFLDIVISCGGWRVGHMTPQPCTPQRKGGVKSL